MGALSGKVAWITGAGSGIGEAAALALAEAGASVVLTGRRKEPLAALKSRLEGSGAQAMAAPGDLAKPETAGEIAAAIKGRFGRLDILVNNAGGNITARRWDQLTPESIDTVLGTNLSAAFYCTAAALPLMRINRDGVLIHTASWAAKWINPVSGTGYTAAKAGVIAMSQALNHEEFRNGIRSTALIPAEVATPILNTRPKPPSEEERERMLQPSDMGELILFIATRPPTVCLNEVVISPTWNRMYMLS
jgi:NADP-dependent 3-hydroxy acid dehydrogenase YdfG